MTYIPDTKNDDYYNEKYLKEKDKDFIKGFDYAVNQSLQFFLENIDALFLLFFCLGVILSLDALVLYINGQRKSRSEKSKYVNKLLIWKRRAGAATRAVSSVFAGDCRHFRGICPAPDQTSGAGEGPGCAGRLGHAHEVAGLYGGTLEKPAGKKYNSGANRTQEVLAWAENFPTRRRFLIWTGRCWTRWRCGRGWTRRFLPAGAWRCRRITRRRLRG